MQLDTLIMLIIVSVCSCYIAGLLTTMMMSYPLRSDIDSSFILTVITGALSLSGIVAFVVILGWILDIFSTITVW